MVKNPYTGFYFVLPFVLMGIAFVILLTTLVPYYNLPETAPLPTPTDVVTVSSPIPVPSDPPAKSFTSRQMGVTFEYPQNFGLKESNGKIILTNGLKIVFQTQQPSTVSVDNFKLTISKLKGNLDKIKSSFYLDDNATISRGDHIFLYGWLGVEGSGEKHYLLKLEGDEWLAINHQVWLDNDVALISTRQKDFLNNDTQDFLVDQILASIKTVKAEKQIGFIKKAYVKNGNQLVDVDYINWINDNTAPNGYRIQNDNPLLRTFSLGPSAVINTINMESNLAKSKISFQEFQAILDDPSNANTSFPYDITIENGVVTQIVARYTP